MYKKLWISLICSKLAVPKIIDSNHMDYMKGKPLGKSSMH